MMFRFILTLTVTIDNRKSKTISYKGGECNV